MAFLDLLDPSNGPEFFWQVISGPPVFVGSLGHSKIPRNKEGSLKLNHKFLENHKFMF
jgi:hypothetical protein